MSDLSSRGAPNGLTVADGVSAILILIVMVMLAFTDVTGEARVIDCDTTEVGT